MARHYEAQSHGMTPLDCISWPHTCLKKGLFVDKHKENEISVAPKLLECLDLRNKIVVGDAMHAQKQVSAQIVDAGGHYLWFIKDNQASTRKADFTFREDKTRMTCKSLGRAMAAINNLLVSLLNLHGFSNHARARRLFDAAPNRAFALLSGL